MLPQKLDLSVKQLEDIDRCLERLQWETEAECVLLADVTGQLISERGRTGRMHTTVLSALAAGELAASKEMARLVGEEARFRMVLHEGERNSVYLADVGEEMLLITVFNNNTPIGMVRVFTKEVVAELLEIVSREETQEDETDDQLGDLEAWLDEELETSLGGEL